jgi:hypothetical protein
MRVAWRGFKQLDLHPGYHRNSRPTSSRATSHRAICSASSGISKVDDNALPSERASAAIWLCRCAAVHGW